LRQSRTLHTLTFGPISGVHFTPAFVGLGATADLAVPLILGDKWLPSVHLIQLLSLAGWLFCIYSIFYTTLLAAGRSRDQLRHGAYLWLSGWRAA
jgi:O-antigen/teichoic acid export membrane protein